MKIKRTTRADYFIYDDAINNLDDSLILNLGVPQNKFIDLLFFKSVKVKFSIANVNKHLTFEI